MSSLDFLRGVKKIKTEEEVKHEEISHLIATDKRIVKRQEILRNKWLALDIKRSQIREAIKKYQNSS